MRIRSTLELGFRLSGSSTGGYSICSRVCGHSRTGDHESRPYGSGRETSSHHAPQDGFRLGGRNDGGREGVKGTEVVS